MQKALCAFLLKNSNFYLEIKLNAASKAVIDDVSLVIEEGARSMESDVAISCGNFPHSEHLIIHLKEKVFRWTQLDEGIKLPYIGKGGAASVDVAKDNGIILVKHECALFITVEQSPYFPQKPPS